MLETLGNLTRHKLRNGLTIGGIVIGIVALTTMGAMAEKTNLLLEGGVAFFSDHVVASDVRAGAFGGGILRVDKVDEVVKVDGVAAAFPVVQLQGKYESGGVSFGPPPFISGTRPGYDQYTSFKLRYARGAHKIVRASAASSRPYSQVQMNEPARTVPVTVASR